MFRACLAQAPRSLASSSHCSSFFHTSTFLNAESSRKAVARAVKKSNNVRKSERWRKAQASKPSVVLGTRPGDDATWQNCDLAKILVDEEELVSNTDLKPVKLPVGTVHMPPQMGFGVGETEQLMLFGKLPLLSAEAEHLALAAAPEKGLKNLYDNLPKAAETLAKAQEKELKKANAFAQLLDLRNANAGGIAYENRRRIIAAFSTPSNPFDPGRSEVQAALLTYQIRNLWTHLINFKRDVGNRRGLRRLVHQRAKILRYLKRKDQDRYETILQQLALEPESVEGELVV